MHISGRSYNLLFFISLCLLTSCSTIRESSKYEFVDGIYKTKIFNNKKTRVYVALSEDSVSVYKLGSRKSAFSIDTLKSLSISFPSIQKDSLFSPHNFTQRSFDLDILTIPFKYRPGTLSLPNQLNTNFNGAMYVGYRRDIHRLTYKRAPLRVFKRKINHYGYSFGFFSGLGATAMNPWVTRDQIAYEYDGLIWLKGIAGIVGINNFTFGIAVGIDHLLDKNSGIWIYQGKQWVGLAFGLNLN